MVDPVPYNCSLLLITGQRHLKMATLLISSTLTFVKAFDCPTAWLWVYVYGQTASLAEEFPCGQTTDRKLYYRPVTRGFR